MKRKHYTGPCLRCEAAKQQGKQGCAPCLATARHREKKRAQSKAALDSPRLI